MNLEWFTWQHWLSWFEIASIKMSYEWIEGTQFSFIYFDSDFLYLPSSYQKVTVLWTFFIHHPYVSLTSIFWQSQIMFQTFNIITFYHHFPYYPSSNLNLNTIPIPRKVIQLRWLTMWSMSLKAIHRGAKLVLVCCCFDTIQQLCILRCQI